MSQNERNGAHLDCFRAKIEHPKIPFEPICGTASLPGSTAVMGPKSKLMLIARRSFETFSLEAKRLDIRFEHRVGEVCFRVSILLDEQSEWPAVRVRKVGTAEIGTNVTCS